MKAPFYVRLTVILILLVLLVVIMYYASAFLVPFCLAGLLAILLNPLVSWMERIGINRVVSIILAIFLVLLVLAGLIYLLSTQVMAFANDIPELTGKVGEKLNRLQGFIEKETDMAPERQISWVREKISSTMENSGEMISSAISTTTSTLSVLALLPIYIFFFLFYREKYKRFLLKVSPEDRHYKVETMIAETKSVVQSYLSGVLIVIAILAVLDSVALMLLGVPYAIFIGILAACLNIIPYIGPLIGSLLAATMAFLTKDSLWYTVASLGIFTFIQFLENNFLTPKITGSKVKLNPFGTILALVIGGQLWGVAGMVLFIPLLGVLKVVFDNIDTLQPYGYLLGTEDGEEDERPRLGDRIRNRFAGKRPRSRDETA